MYHRNILPNAPNMIFLFFFIKLKFANTEIQLKNLENVMSSEEWRTKLEWSHCFILEEDHPWKGLRVRKRQHPFTYSNETQDLLNRTYQLKLCDCYQPVNHILEKTSQTEKEIIFEFSYMMSIEKIIINLSQNYSTFEILVDLAIGITENFINYTRSGNINNFIKFKMYNPPYLKSLKLNFINITSLEFEKVNVSFFGCSLVCGGVKNSYTDMLYYISMQLDFPTMCLWYIEPYKATSIVFNVLSKEIDCDISDIIIIDGNLKIERENKDFLTSLCKQSIDSTESILYSKVWILYTNGGSKKLFVEHFSFIYHGGCDRQYILDEDEGSVNVSIHGASDIKKMKFDCSIVLRKQKSQPFVISFDNFYLFSLTKSGCTSNYMMIYSGSDEVYNIPFCDSISPPKYILVRYGWVRLKIINNAPIYDINMIINHKILKLFDVKLLNISTKSNDTDKNYEATASLIAMWTIVGFAICMAIVAIFFKHINKIFKYTKSKFKLYRNFKNLSNKELALNNLDNFC